MGLTLVFAGFRFMDSEKEKNFPAMTAGHVPGRSENPETKAFTGSSIPSE
jgi:hypothetical protein